MLEIPSRVDVGKDQRVNQGQMSAKYANELSGKSLEILRESWPKTGMQEMQSCKIQGMLTLSIHAACCIQ